MSNRSISKPYRICQVEGCNNKHQAKGYCDRHYRQMRKYGKIFGNPKKLKRGEPNRCIFDGDTCKIELCDKKGNVRDYTIIDVEDYEKVKNFRWSINKKGYVRSSKRGDTRFMLHCLILKLPCNKYPDHIDQNPLNNRKLNLRVCTHQQNCFNQGLSSQNTSGFKGVSRDNLCKKWKAQIRINNELKYLGNFEKKVDAAIAYNVAATKYCGEFAHLNNV